MNTHVTAKNHSLLLLAPLFSLAFCFSGTAAAAEIDPGTGLGAANSTSTGIYHIVTVNNNKRHQILALAHKGKVREIHTKTNSGGYLKRGTGSKAITISTQKFNQLISIAGGLNKDVEKLPVAQKNQFYTLAGLSAPAPLQMEVPPGPNNSCPQGYELKFDTTTKPIKRVCKILTLNENDEQLFAALKDWWASTQIKLIPEAQASLAIADAQFNLGNFFDFKVRGDATGAVSSGQSVWRIEAFGFSIVFTEDLEGT